MTTYCAPCITDLALLREAVTGFVGTACCAAHAVLLTYPHDAPGRRRARLAQLRGLAEAKSATAPLEEQPGLDLLMHEYTLAGAMDMGGQPRPDGSAPARGERHDRQGERADRQGEPGSRSAKRRGRGRGDRALVPADGAAQARPAVPVGPGGTAAPDGGTLGQGAGPAEASAAPVTGLPPVEPPPPSSTPQNAGPGDGGSPTAGAPGAGSSDAAPSPVAPSAPSLDGGSSAADTSAAAAPSLPHEPSGEAAQQPAGE